MTVVYSSTWLNSGTFFGRNLELLLDIPELFLSKKLYYDLLFQYFCYTRLKKFPFYLYTFFFIISENLLIPTKNKGNFPI